VGYDNERGKGDHKLYFNPCGLSDDGVGSCQMVISTMAPSGKTALS